MYQEVSGKKLTKATLVDKLIEQYNLSKREAKVLVDDFFDVIKSGLKDKDMVKLSGFGNFKANCKGERPGRNPRTNKPVTVSARRVVTFDQGDKIQRAMNS